MIPTETKRRHTPGPWNVEHPFGESGVYVAGPTTALIAQLYVADSGPKETEANAKLLAAAPDLFTFAQDVAAWLVAPDLSPETLAIFEAQARAAISKATD